MPIKTIIFVAVFFAACGGTLYWPLVGVLGYVMEYQIGSSGQWWADPIANWGLRYSFILGALTLVSAVIHRRGLRYGEALLTNQEWLLILFLVMIWLSYVFQPTNPAFWAGEDIPAVKMTKIIMFALLLSHIVTTMKAIDLFFWAIVVGALFLGYQAYTAGEWGFSAENRLDGIGGADFRESNGLGGYLAASLFIILIQFLRSRWAGRLLCLAAGAFAVNGIILTRSRGAFVALGLGAASAVLMAPKKYRIVVLVGLVVGAIGAYRLTDPGFWERAGTITASDEERDASAQSRINIWKGSFGLVKEHPLGVGGGNFATSIGQYVPAHVARDAHSSYVLCWSELGIPGALLYFVLMFNAARLLWQTHKQSGGLPEADRDAFRLTVYATATALVVFAGCGLTMSRLYAEAPWWFLALPVCLKRALENRRAETGLVSLAPLRKVRGAGPPRAARSRCSAGVAAHD